MLIYRNGIYKNVTKSAFLERFKGYGFVEYIEKVEEPKLSPKQLLQKQADELDIKYVEKTTSKELMKLIEAQKDGEN